jgi:large subunit ribosomal protein L31e
MADEKSKDKKLDRTYIIPIRRLSVKTETWRKATKSMYEIRKFMKRHMKSDDVKIGQELNELIWARGGKTVPSRVEIHAVREDGVVRLNLVGCELPAKVEKKEEKKAAKKEEAVKKNMEKIVEAVAPEDKKEEAKAEAVVKELAKEIKEDAPKEEKKPRAKKKLAETEKKE